MILLVLILVAIAGCSTDVYVHGVPETVCVDIPQLPSQQSCASRNAPPPEPEDAGTD